MTAEIKEIISELHVRLYQGRSKLIKNNRRNVVVGRRLGGGRTDG